MTYYTTADSSSTGTCNNYYNYYNDYNEYMYQNSTTTSSDYLDGFSTAISDYFNRFSTTDALSTWTQSTQAYTGILYIVKRYSKEVVHKPSEEELSRQKEERIKAAEAAKKAREEADEAAKKARLLLMEYLDNENIGRLLNKEPLEVQSRLFADIKYQIPISNGRIKTLKENKVITELCLAVKESGYLPTDDIILTKLLHILHDEENMLRTANHFNKQENLLARLN